MSWMSPIPGDPAGVKDAAARYLSTADSIDEAARELLRVANEIRTISLAVDQVRSQSAELAGVRILNETTVWAAFSPTEVAAVVAGRSTIFRPRRLVLATGAYEQPWPVPGWTLPGVMTVGGLQTLARERGLAMVYVSHDLGAVALPIFKTRCKVPLVLLRIESDRGLV